MFAQASTDHLNTVISARWRQTAEKIACLAEAIPAEHFEHPLVPELRTCGAVLRHVAFWNQYVGDSLSGRNTNDGGNELSRSSFPDKDSILAELKRTSDEVLFLLGDQGESLTSGSAELILSFVEHTSEHYGQLVVYSRLAGIVPPASRG